MTDTPNQPRDYDVVLGSQNIALTSAAVLGGLARVKTLLTSHVVEQKTTALQEALKYGQSGLDIIIQALQDESEPLHKAAYRVLLSKIEEPRVKQALREYNPYRFFECLQTLRGHPHCAVASLAISTNGQTVVSGGAYHDKTIRVWDLPTEQEILILKGHSHIISSLILSPDGQTLVSSSHDTTIKIWNLRTGREIRTLKAESAVTAIAISPDWQILVNGSYDCTIKIWNLNSGQEVRTLKGHTGTVSCVTLSADGKTLISGSGDSTIKVWDVRTGREIRTLKGHASSVTSVALSPDGDTLFSGSDRTIKVWDVRTGQEICTFKGHSGYVLALACSSDEQTLISGGNSHDKTIKIWNWRTGQEICTLEGHPVGVCFALSADGQTLVSGSYDLKVWGVGVR